MALTVLFGLALIATVRAFSGRADAASEAELSRPSARVRWRSGPIFSIGWSPDGGTLAATYGDSELGFYGIKGGDSRKVRLDGPGPLWVVGWSPGARGPLLWDLDGALAETPGSPPGPGPEPVRLAGGVVQNLATTGRGRSIRLWGPSDRRERILPDSARPANCIAISPDGRTIASGGGDGRIRLIDVATGRERSTVKFDPRPFDYLGVSMVAFGPDGRTLAACGAGAVRIYDATTGEELSQVGPTSAGYSVVAFSPDARHLAAATWNGSLRIWDAATGREERRFALSPTRILALTWSPDGRSLASGGFDGEVSVWDASPSADPAVPATVAAR